LCAAPSEVAGWVSAAWKAILDSIIVRSFKKCCISYALDGSEDDILWEDNGEDKDDSDLVTDTLVSLAMSMGIGLLFKVTGRLLM